MNDNDQASALRRETWVGPMTAVDHAQREMLREYCKMDLVEAVESGADIPVAVEGLYSRYHGVLTREAMLNGARYARDVIDRQADGR